MNAQQAQFLKDVVVATREPEDVPMAVAVAKLYMDACDDLGISGSLNTDPPRAAAARPRTWLTRFVEWIPTESQMRRVEAWFERAGRVANDALMVAAILAMVYIFAEIGTAFLPGGPVDRIFAERAMTIANIVPAKDEDRMAYIDANGDMKCIVRAGALVTLPIEFNDTLHRLRCDLDLALDCIHVWGGVPLPVAEAVLRGVDAAVAGLDLGLKKGAR